MPRKIRRDSVSGQVKAASDAKIIVPVPAGVVLNDEERIVWKQITDARAPDSWRECDLLLVAKAVKLEVMLREATADLGTDLVIDGVRNPLVAIIDTLAKQQLSIYRLLSLSIKAVDAPALDSDGKSAIKPKPGLSLLA